MTTKYTPDHEWIKADGDIATVGITHHAQDALGDVVFVDLPEVGKTYAAKDAAAVVESVKAASDIYSPVSGVIEEANDALSDSPERVNQDSYTHWLFRVKASDVSELDKLLTTDQYITSTESK